MRGLYLHSREYRKIFLKSHFLRISQLFGGNYFGAYTCRACMRTRTNTGKYSWGIIYVLVSCQGVNINFLVRLLLGHPRNVPGTNRVCPRDKVGLSQGQTQVFILFYTAEAQFVPGTNPVCPWDIPGTKGGRQSLCVKSLCAFFAPY